MGFEFEPLALWGGFETLNNDLRDLEANNELANKQWDFANVDSGDCSSLQFGLARTFCDLHCIRDAVKKGNEAILESLENVVDIVGQNTQLLFEHYLGSSEGAVGLLQNSDRVVRQGIQAGMAEIQSMVRDNSFDKRSTVATTRALQNFAGRWKGRKPEGGNISTNLMALALDVKQLHATASGSKRKASAAEDIQQSTLRYADTLQSLLKDKARTLGVYSKHSKMHAAWKLKSKDILAELQDQATQEALQFLDSSWWQFRADFDEYLGAAG